MSQPVSTSAKEGGERRSQLLSQKIVNLHFFIACTGNNTCFPLIAYHHQHALDTVGGNLKMRSSIGATRSNLHPPPPFFSVRAIGQGRERGREAGTSGGGGCEVVLSFFRPTTHSFPCTTTAECNFPQLSLFSSGQEEKDEEENTKTKQQLRKTYIFLAAPNE